MNMYISVRTNLYVLVFILTFPLCPENKTWGAVPPPPVNQLIGFYDTSLEDPTENTCRDCHDNGLEDRHHLLMNFIIPQRTDAPFGIPGTPYECLSCHAEDVSTGVIDFLVERDCLECHVFIPDSKPATPHHITQDALDMHCSSCHGSVVQDFDDDHYIPDYDISSVTPDPFCKTWDGPICVSGGCYVCHTDDPAANPAIIYKSLHHKIGFTCSVCHPLRSTPEQTARACQSCHAPDSLHNIQADSDNPANPGMIIPGEEDLGWGHIGNGWDCFGCHESFNDASAFMASSAYMASVTPQTGATIPSITGLSTKFTTAQRDTVLDIYGSGFINETGGVTFVPDVLLDNGITTVTLEKTSITVNSIGATVPSTLPVGLYDLRVVKDDKLSNKEILSVIPGVFITNVTCSKKKGVLTVNGSGFGEKPAGTDAYINVQVNGQNQDIISWSDSLIKASVSSCRGNDIITINALMGAVTNGGDGKPDKPCKGKRCN
jgi:hypothetical protein